MHKKVLFLFFLLLSLITHSQEEIVTFKNTLKTSSSSVKSIIPIVNQENGGLALFIADAKNVYAYKFDNKFSLQNKLLSPEKKRKFKVLIGSSITENNSYRVFMTNKGYNKFSSVRFSFNGNESSFNEFKFKNINEKFIQTVTYKNKFYLISAVEISPNEDSYIEAVYIYTFNDNGDPKRNKIDLSNLKFLNKSGNSISLPNLLIPFSNSIKKIEDNVPNSIEVASDSRKMYLRGKTIIFTFDRNKKVTQVLKINLETLHPTLQSFDKPLSNLKKARKRTNSYLNGNKLFIVASTKETFKLQINDFEKGILLKEFGFTDNDSISFKNTPIIQEGGVYDKYRELESSVKFLRKITAGKIGVSSVKINNKYHITIGGYVEQRSGGMMMPMGGFGGIPIGSFGSFNVFFNPTMYAFNSMSTTKSTRIECLLDDNFNHVKGKIENSAFDKINFYKKEARFKGEETVLKYKDYFILVDYNTFSKDYTLRKFKD